MNNRRISKESYHDAETSSDTKNSIAAESAPVVEFAADSKTCLNAESTPDTESIHDSKTDPAGPAKKAAFEAPDKPGVYIMRDEEGRIIYIGKAKSLKNRLKSYFYGEKDIKTATLLKRLHSIETIIVATEYEALLLENNLIKQHSPRYNINLKDGKTYPVIRITNEDFPRIFRTRRVVEDNSQYYGPFPNVTGLDSMMEIIDKLIPIRKCRVPSSKLAGRKRGPCMYYHIGRCLAPCCGRISADEYNCHVEQVKKLISGETEKLIADLTARMREAAGTLQFEKAAHLRNTIRAIEKLAGEESSVMDLDPEGRDYIAWATSGVLATYTVFSMRGGKMTGQELYRARSASDETESLELFITSYYDPGRPPPGKIFLQPAALPDSKPTPDSESNTDIKTHSVVPYSESIPEAKINSAAPNGTQAHNNETASGAKIHSAAPNGTQAHNNETASGAKIHSAAPKLDSWFKDQFGFIPEMIVSGETHHAAILAMARQNASEDLRKRLKDRGAGPALDELAQVLNLETRPQLIEGFDIAQLDGKHPVASLISFKNGIPDRKNYRYFKLRSVIGVVDDYASIREAVRRRYTRQIREGEELPDLILIDGGIGQVNTAKAVMDELGLNCGIVGLAKREEELWLPDAREPIVLSRRSEALKVLQHVRDECHRFATTLNQKLRSKDLFFPVLESVDGIGPARAAAIMKVYENIDNIAVADPTEIAGRCGISEISARAVRAVAKNAVEDREDSVKRLNTGRHNTESGQFSYNRRSYTMRLAEEAAEDEGEYGTGPSRESGD